MSETCIDFYSKNKLEKLVHLVGFITRSVVCVFTILVVKPK